MDQDTTQSDQTERDTRIHPVRWTDQDENIKQTEEEIQEKMKEAELRHRSRAERFGSEYVPPKESVVLGFKRAAKRSGFITGFDMYSEEEQRKKVDRANRFGVSAAELADPSIAEDSEKLHKRRERIERFAMGIGMGIGSEIGRQGVPGEAAIDSSNVDGTVAMTTINVADPVDQEFKQAMEVDPLENRRVAARDEQVRESVLHLYGVDQLSTKDIVTYFQDFGPSWVEWINDSSCNVAFEDVFTAKRVFNNLKIGDAEKIDDPNKNIQLKWIRIKAFPCGEIKLPLQLRYATELDIRPEKPNPKSHWSRTYNNSGRNEPHRVNRTTTHRNRYSEPDLSARRGRRRRGRGFRTEDRDEGALGVHSRGIRKSNSRQERDSKDAVMAELASEWTERNENEMQEAVPDND